MAVEERPLLGRDQELRELAGVLADVSSHRGRVVLVTGEAGLGKTSLAEETAQRSLAVGFTVAWGRCSPTDVPPYWPWVQVLKVLLGSAELLERHQFPSSVEQLAAVAEAVEARAGDHPLLVVLEDLHWADAGTLALFRVLAGSVAGQRLCLLATTREDGDHLPAGGHVHRLELAGLDLDETALLVERITGSSPGPSYVEELHHRTNGNPFFVTEVGRLQASRGGGTGGTLPTGVRQVLEHRLARLPQETVELLEAASVLGSPRASVLAEMSSIGPDRVAELLEPALAARVIGPEGFVHELMRETLYDGLSDHRRAELHRLVAETLQAGGPAELARHWSLAAGDDARPRAAALAATAGDFAVDAFAYEQAVEHYRMALDLGPADRSLRRRLGAAMVLSGRITDGRAILREVALQARQASDPEELALAVLAMGGGVGGFEVDVFDPEQAALIEDALALLPGADTPLRAALLARRSLTSAPTATFEARVHMAHEAVDVARRADDAAAEVSALAALCDALSGPDHVQQRLDATGRMLDLAHGKAVLELLARRMRIRARLELGDFAGARSDVAAYAVVADRLRSPTYGWLVTMWRGLFAELDGDLEVAARYADETEALGVAAQSDNAAMMAWSLRWRIARRRHDTALVRRLLTPMTEYSENYPGWAHTFVLLYAETGEHDRGRALVRRTMASGLDSLPRDSEWLELMWSLGEATMALDEKEASASVLALLEPYADLWAVDGWGAACFGQVSELLARLRSHSGEGPATPDDATFVRSGTLWQVAYAGRTATLVDSKGLHDLAALLATPGRQVYAVDLVEAGGGASRTQLGGDTGPVLDAPARAAYKRRLVELEDELDRAALDHDEGRLATLEAEKEFLLAELGAALGIGGRVRVGGDPAERARKAVTMRIRGALKAMEPLHPELARHLRNSVTTGRACCYRPEREISWRLA